MRWTLFAGLVLLAGCQGVVGPARRACLDEKIDNPCLSIEEQQQRARDRLALPLDSPIVGPPTNAGQFRGGGY
jgi:hypothetical protein